MTGRIERSGDGAQLYWVSRPAHPQRVALLLHGRAGTDEQPPRWSSGVVLRMVLFGRVLRRRGGKDLAVARLVYSQRRWQAHDRVADARWALRRIAARYPDRPVALIGHSMGVRVALRVAAITPAVDRIAGYGAWVEAEDASSWPDAARAAELEIRLVHGRDDRITQPRGSQYVAQVLGERGARVSLDVVDGETHAMLKQARRWHRDAAEHVLAAHHAPRHDP